MNKLLIVLFLCVVASLIAWGVKYFLISDEYLYIALMMTALLMVAILVIPNLFDYNKIGCFTIILVVGYVGFVMLWGFLNYSDYKEYLEKNDHFIYILCKAENKNHKVVSFKRGGEGIKYTADVKVPTYGLSSFDTLVRKFDKSFKNLEYHHPITGDYVLVRYPMSFPRANKVINPSPTDSICALYKNPVVIFHSDTIKGEAVLKYIEEYKK